MIGQDNAEALVPLRVARGHHGEPFATLSMFGWSVNGSSVNRTSDSVISNFISLDAKIERQFHIEDQHVGNKKSWSVDDTTVIKLWQKECRLVDDHL